MRDKTRKQLNIYVSKPLDYSPHLFETIAKKLESQGFIVTTFTGEKYTEEKLNNADVVLFLTKDFDPIFDEDNNTARTGVYEDIARGQHSECKKAKKLGKFCITFSCFQDKEIFVWETQDATVVKDNGYWGKGYAKLYSTFYGAPGAELFEFVTGHMSIEKGIEHISSSQSGKSGKNLLLLLVTNSS